MTHTSASDADISPAWTPDQLVSYPIWTPDQLAAFFHGEFSLKTLANWRSARIGPPFFKAGTKPFYRQAAALEWCKNRERSTAAGREVA